MNEMRMIVLFLFLIMMGANAQEVALIPDPHFQRGFKLFGTNPLKQSLLGTLGATAEMAPCWRLVEWWCDSSIAGTVAEVLPSGALKFQTKSRLVVLGPAGSPEADLTLGLNSIVEFGGRLRAANEDWPHLLVEQNFSECAHPSPPLDQLQALSFHVEARLLKDEQQKPEGYSPSLHAAQLLIYFTVANKKTGDFLWFGVVLYDDRTPMPGIQIYPGDGGSAGLGKYIYSPAVSSFTTESLHSRQWVTYDANLLPLICDGLKAAWKDGFLPESQTEGDYVVGYMSLGFELPGLHDIQAQVRNLRLSATEKAK
ncbi:MAG: hypothetical protein HYZ00_09770 [Candidatus Hydrogenedentes bacterium]|nr:hypothetical protein [Candidatus Hydrogenedentota bacterium]